LRNRFLWPILALNFCNYASTFTVQGLWGGPFLREVHGLSPIEAGNVLLLAVVTYQAGMLAFGPLDRLLDTRKSIAIGGSLVIVALLAILALASRPPVWVAVGAILVIGFFSASSTMVMTHARGVFPDRRSAAGFPQSTRRSCSGSPSCSRYQGLSSEHSSRSRTAPAPRPPIAPCSAC
jgi:predicted MFS family arabinose efflux permease